MDPDNTGPYPSMVMKLGDQNDTARFSNADGAGIYNSIDLGTGDDTYTTAATGTFDGIKVWGQGGDDTITVRTGSTVTAGDGSDTVRVIGKNAYVHAGAGDDVIHGGNGGQTLLGHDGDDVIRGGSKKDVIAGGRGDDLLYGAKGNDTIKGNSGADKLYGNSGNDSLYGGPGKDALSGGPGKDRLRQN